MKKLFFFIFGSSFLAVAYATGPFISYIPSTNTYQGNSSVINIASASITTANIASGTIRNLNLGFNFNTYNVLNYGIVADSATDITTLANSIINSTVATSGGIVYFPPGDYAVASGDGVNVLRSSVTILGAKGAIFHKTGSGAAITLARSANTSISNVTIDGLYITASDTNASAGISIAPDATNIANKVSIQNCIIDGMGQYGIVIPSTNGGADDLTIRDTKILNNGSTAGTHSRQALIINPATNGIQRLFISNVYAEEKSNPPGGTSETDGCKIQFSTGAQIVNFHCKGGGSASITGNTMVFNQNSNLTATNLIVEGTGGGGFQIDSSTAGVEQFTNVICTGTFSSNNGIILAANGSHHLHINGIYSDDQVIATAGSYHDDLIIENGIIRQGIRIENGTTTNSTFRNLKMSALTFVVGNNNTFDGIISTSSTGTGLRVTGNKNIFTNNKIYAPASYGFQVAGDSNAITNNYVDGSASGLANIASGTGNVIGPNATVTATDTTVTDSGTTSRCGKIVFGPASNIMTCGTGSPETVVAATVGSVYFRVDGSSVTTLYVKTTGGGGNTGWVAK